MERFARRSCMREHRLIWMGNGNLSQCAKQRESGDMHKYLNLITKLFKHVQHTVIRFRHKNSHTQLGWKKDSNSFISYCNYSQNAANPRHRINPANCFIPKIRMIVTLLQYRDLTSCGALPFWIMPLISSAAVGLLYGSLMEHCDD